MSIEYNHPEALLARARRIALLCLDVDGTLTDGSIDFDEDGRESKRFHVHDGLGIALLRRHGIDVAFVTARHSPVAERRAAELGAEAHTRIKDKRACVQEMLARRGLAAGQVAFMGDDLVDLPALALAGLAAAPANCHPWLHDRVHFTSTRPGGHGAVRELCDLLLLAQGHANAALEGFGGAQ
ncbi:MAG: phenylphosphate carboxylase subunit delta [Pseudoxanthomonas suwonensis]|nr:phenylphosphate carboxylase subunit delta [Pseudoxanthomonas suwonensis]